jgi:hypothetical protein
MIVGVRRLFAAPLWLAILVNILSLLGSIPLAIMFMRSPV